MKSIANIIHKNKFPLRFLDSNENTIYYEDSIGYWWKCEFYGEFIIYYENSLGNIQDSR